MYQAQNCRRIGKSLMSIDRRHINRNMRAVAELWVEMQKLRPKQTKALL
jgi:hypothetical protein